MCRISSNFLVFHIIRSLHLEILRTVHMREDVYDVDEEDVRWLGNVEHSMKTSFTLDEFEETMALLESNSRKTVLGFATACLKLPNMDRRKLCLIYDYWLN